MTRISWTSNDQLPTREVRTGEILPDRSRIRAPTPGRARFVRCSFRDVRLKEWLCWNAEFVDCVFTGRADQMIFNADTPEDLGRAVNEYSANDFGGMSLKDTSFRGGIDLTRQVLPAGDEYVLLSDAREAIVSARAQVSLWDDRRPPRG